MKTISILILSASLLASCTSSGPSGGGNQPSVFVAPESRSVAKVAVLPFRGPTELIGTSVSDTFGTELMKTRRYELIERSQLSGVLGETEVQLSGLTAGQAAQLGQMLGAQAVVIGTVSEYENMAVRGKPVPVVGINARLIDASSGKILWSVDHASRGGRSDVLAQHARAVVAEMVSSLNRQLR